MFGRAVACVTLDSYAIPVDVSNILPYMMYYIWSIRYNYNFYV